MSGILEKIMIIRKSILLNIYHVVSRHILKSNLVNARFRFITWLKLSSEELLTAYKEVKEKHDQIQEFEVVLAEYQIDKVVKEGLFIKMNYGVKKDGLELFKSSV